MKHIENNSRQKCTTHIELKVLKTLSKGTLSELYFMDCISAYLDKETFENICHLLAGHIVDAISYALRED